MTRWDTNGDAHAEGESRLDVLTARHHGRRSDRPQNKYSTTSFTISRSVMPPVKALGRERLDTRKARVASSQTDEREERRQNRG